MKLKGLTLAAIAAAYCFGDISAQEDKRIGTRITEATVFMQGAELVHTAQAQLKKGAGEIIFEGLSPNIDRNSLKVNIGGSVVISAFEYSIDYLSSARKSPGTLKVLQDSIDICEARLTRINIDLQVNSGIMSYLETGVAKNVSGSDTGLGIEELKNTMDYYKSKSEEVLVREKTLMRERTELEADIRRIKAQYNQESGKNNRTSGILKLNITAPVAGTFPVTITYYTTAANWTPYYDVTIASIDKPVRIAFKSKVVQTTGLDWENVKLTLSTAVPSNGKVAPLFSTWFLREQVRNSSSLSGFVNFAATQNSISYADSKVMDEVVVTGFGKREASSQSRGYEAPAEPLVVIDGRISSQAELARIDPELIKEYDIMDDSTASDLYGSKAANGVIVVTLKSSMDDFVTEQSNALNVVYSIDMPYTIPGNGKAQNIDLVTKEAAAEYKYYCAPRLDPATYLVAEIPDWQNLGLLSGSANVTYDGTYIGEVFIDAASTHQKLALTLGTDKRVVVKRELMRDFSSVKTLGNDIQKVYTYKLTVKNNQSLPVQMVLKDQYPLSTQKNIVVLLNVKETTPWTANKEETGVITWEEELGAGETRTYQIGYSVKYPKTMNLNL